MYRDSEFSACGFCITRNRYALRVNSIINIQYHIDLRVVEDGISFKFDVNVVQVIKVGKYIVSDYFDCYEIPLKDIYKVSVKSSEEVSLVPSEFKLKQYEVSGLHNIT